MNLYIIEYLSFGLLWTFFAVFMQLRTYAHLHKEEKFVKFLLCVFGNMFFWPIAIFMAVLYFEEIKNKKKIERLNGRNNMF